MGRLILRKVITMRKCYILWALVIHAVTAAEVPLEKLERFKRQDLDEDALEKQLCSDKGAGEWFRLETGEDKCRDVIQCTSSGLQAIRCPAGLAFDIEKQTCDWKDSVKNSDAKRAPPCDTTICKLPDCFCSEDGPQVPGNLCK